MESSPQRGRDGFDSEFAQRMVAARLTPSSRIGIAVSGGPDSTALCILASRWIEQEGGDTSSLMGFIVDHDLRVESASEALLVQSRVAALGISSEVLKCSWQNGLPSHGQMQEAARNARYKLIHEACRRNRVDALFTAHHLNDQIELFIIRLSRHSGLAGLAGMPFVSKLYRFEPDYDGNGGIHAILLVRPLLKMSKNNLYEVCMRHTQPWVEDPTNRKFVFLRNMVRGLLNEADYCILTKELPGLIMLCQKLRRFFDGGRDALLLECASINQNFGHVVIDLEKLKPAEGQKQVLSRALGAVLQFVAQKEKPPRGKVVQMLVDFINRSTLKGALTLAGCNISLAPGSKGTRLLICASYESKGPVSAVSIVWTCNHSNIGSSGPHREDKMEVLKPHLCLDNGMTQTELPSRFKNLDNSAQLLSEARGAGMLSDSSTVALSKLQDILSLKPKSRKMGNLQKETEELSGVQGNLQIPCNHACYFMNRFCIAWGEGPKQATSCEGKPSSVQLAQKCEILSAESSSLKFRKGLSIRCMQEQDWTLLSNCTEQKILSIDSYNSFTRPNSKVGDKTESQQKVQVLPCCIDGLPQRVQGGLAKLKSIPLPVRRGLPVLVTAEGALISIPSVGLNLCPRIWASARFCPRLPLGGGLMLWL